jgi:putative phosphoribosyl transferase
MAMEAHKQGLKWKVKETEIHIPIGKLTLEGTLRIPDGSEGIVLFAHGSGSSRFSPRNQFVAKVLNESRHSTLLFDLLTKEEEAVDDVTRELRFDIGLLAERLADVTDWVTGNTATRDLKIGYFGASTGAAAALVAAAERSEVVQAVVSRGGRPDLAGPALKRVKAATLLIVGAADTPVIPLNQEAFEELKAVKKLEIVPGATHLFEEEGTLESVARLAANWFDFYLKERKHHSLRTG